MFPQPQQKRVDGEHPNSGKKSRALAIPDAVVKQEQRRQGEEEAGQGGQGDGALAAVVQAMEEEEQINIRMAVSHLHCHACVLPLKPPTFKCEAGHVVCGACRCSHVQACAGAGTGTGTCVPCEELDRIVRDAKVPCAYEKYG